MEVRTLADWVVRQRLLTIPGIAQVITMGGGRKQYQVLVNADALRSYGVTLHDVERALAASNANATGGYLNRGATGVPGPLDRAGCRAWRTSRRWWSRPAASGPCCWARSPGWSKRRKSSAAIRPSTARRP